MTPNRAKNEEELNEDATKGQNTTHNDTGKWFCVENLVRNCTRNSIGANFFREFSSIQNFENSLGFVFVTLSKSSADEVVFHLKNWIPVDGTKNSA